MVFIVALGLLAMVGQKDLLEDIVGIYLTLSVRQTDRINHLLVAFDNLGCVRKSGVRPRFFDGSRGRCH